MIWLSLVGILIMFMGLASNDDALAFFGWIFIQNVQIEVFQSEKVPGTTTKRQKILIHWNYIGGGGSSVQ